MNELALFSGSGGGILGGRLLGWRTVCAVEFDAPARSTLLKRQRDGILKRFPIWDDVQTFQGHPWKGKVDVITGGFPCQDISVAGRQAGIEGAKSGLWKHMSRIIGEVHPRFTLIENSPALCFRGLGDVLRDLAYMGFDARWGVLGAGHLQYPIKRDRIWILGVNHSLNEHRTEWEILKEADIEKHLRRTKPSGHISTADPSWLVANSYAVRELDGLAGRMDRFNNIGNGQVPDVAAIAYRMLGGIVKVNS